MQLKASIDYGLRAVLYLAHKDGLCSSRDIAREMAIPRDYLIQLAQLLRNAGIVEARPGKHGGYRLAKDPSEISLLSVMTALDEEPKTETRKKQSRRRGLPAKSEEAERIKRAYQLALESYDSYLNAITLDMLLDCSGDPSAGEACLTSRFLQKEGSSLAYR